VFRPGWFFSSRARKARLLPPTNNRVPRGFEVPASGTGIPLLPRNYAPPPRTFRNLFPHRFFRRRNACKRPRGGFFAVASVFEEMFEGNLAGWMDLPRNSNSPTIFSFRRVPWIGANNVRQNSPPRVPPNPEKTPPLDEVFFFFGPRGFACFSVAGETDHPDPVFSADAPRFAFFPIIQSSSGVASPWCRFPFPRFFFPDRPSEFRPVPALMRSLFGKHRVARKMEGWSPEAPACFAAPASGSQLSPLSVSVIFCFFFLFPSKNRWVPQRPRLSRLRGVFSGLETPFGVKLPPNMSHN